MPFKVVNHNHPRRAKQPPPPPPKTNTRQDSSSSTETAANHGPDRISLHSAKSSDDGTLHITHSDLKFREEEDEKLPVYHDEKGMNHARYFEKEKQRASEEYDPYSVENMDPAMHLPAGSSSLTHVSKTAHQLSSALGPDNVSHTTEIDSIPCAGVRIPHGPLLGLLAWRLVVRIPEASKHRGSWWVDQESTAARKRRRGSTILPPPPHKPSHSHSYSEWDPPMLHGGPFATISSSSLPLAQQSPLARRSHPHLRNTSLNPSFSPSSSHKPKKPTALVSNFILDTSLPYSLISRDTLIVLGYPSSYLPAPLDPHCQSDVDADDVPCVTLSIQGVSTRLRIANPGEASRLGVQFLQDAGVSVFFPRDGAGVGPVLYVESSRNMKDVPTTLPLGARTQRFSLQQRVRILFGMVPS